MLYIFINLFFYVDILKINRKSSISLVPLEFSQQSVSENTAGSPEIFTEVFFFYQWHNHKGMGWVFSPITRLYVDAFDSYVLVDYDTQFMKVLRNQWEIGVPTDS